MSKKCFLSFALILLLASCGRSGVIYVSPGGDDAASGKRFSPLKTLQEACDRAGSMGPEGPVTIILAGGEYAITEPVRILSVPRSGLLVRGAGMGKTVISGGKRLPRFVEQSDSLWVIDLNGRIAKGESIPQLFVNGLRAVPARTPNGFKHFKTGELDEIPAEGYEGLALDRVKLPGEAVSALGAVAKGPSSQLKITMLYEWMQTTRIVANLDLSDSTAAFLTTPFGEHHKSVSQFFFENDLSLMDEPGEWFHDKASARLYYIPRPGESVESCEAVIPSSPQLLVLRGNLENRISNVRIEGISWLYSDVQSEDYGPGGQAASDVEAAVRVDFADGVVFEDCEIAHTGGTALWLRESCRDCLVSRCYIHDLGAGGVYVGDPVIPEDEEALLTRKVTVDNNIIRDGSRIVAPGTGVVIFQSSDNSVSHNDISDFKYTGISVGWVWTYDYSPAKRNLIVDNHIHHLGWGALSDMAGIYTLGESEGTRLEGNVIHDIYTLGYNGCGIYLDQASTRINIENNMVYNCKTSSFNQHFGKENMVHNNLFLNGMYQQFSGTKNEGHVSYYLTGNVIYSTRSHVCTEKIWTTANTVVDNNIYWNEGCDTLDFSGMNFDAWRAFRGQDIHSLVEDPQFMDVEGGDFRMGNTAALEKIGFRQFDYTKAGVYGSKDWKALSVYENKVGFKGMVDWYESMLWADLPYMRKLYLIDN